MKTILIPSIGGKRLHLCVVLAIVGGLLGCQPAGKPDGQVVARVNRDELSVHQLNFALTHARSRPGAANGREALLETMIDRQLAVQQALSLGLDRRPDVMMRLEEMRLETLATAYAAEMARLAPKPTDAQVAAFYREHPGVFAQRRVYRLREVAVPVATPLLADLKTRLDERQPLTQTLAWLKQQQIPHTDQTAVRPAEDLPVNVVDRLAQLPAGQWLAFQTPGALLVYDVLSSDPAPMAWAQSAPVIRSHLTQELERTHLREALKALRQKAEISRNLTPVTASSQP